MLEHVPRLGVLSDAPRVVREHRIDHVFVALPQSSSASMMSLLDSLVREVCSIHVVPDLLQFMALRSRVTDLEGLPTIHLSDSPLLGWSRFVKRLFDIGFSAIALIVLAPLMAFLALLIWLEDRGPIFYRRITNRFHIPLLFPRRFAVFHRGEQVGQVLVPKPQIPP